MKRRCAALALGLGLLAAGFGRAGKGDTPTAPATPAAAPAAPAAAPHGPAAPAHAGECGGGCGGAHGSCWEQLCAFFSYRALPVPWCCRCMCGCCRAYVCHPPVYTYFLAEPCHEGRWYGHGPCCGERGHHRCGGCGGADHGPVPYGPNGPVPVGAVIPAPALGTPVGSPTPPVAPPGGPVSLPETRETAPMPAPVPARPGELKSAGRTGR
jgi:hypothetical protein